MSRPLVRDLARRLPFFYGWAVVGCAMCSNVARQGAAVATLSMFVVPMTLDFGWSRTGISGAVSLGSLLGALAAPFIGPLFDRHGSRALLVASAFVMSACCVALAGTQSLPWFYAAFALSRMTFSTPFDVGTASAVAKWFVSRRTAAMSFLAMSTGVGLAVIPFVAQMVIVAHGWRAGWLALAAIVLVIGVLPQWLLLVRQPEDLGLVPAIRWYAETHLEERGVATTVDPGPTPPVRLAPHLEVALFRIAQEAINNIARHAEAHRATIRLSFSDPIVRIEVADDGRGFDVHRALASPGNSVGLIGLQERTRLLNGRIDIRSEAGRGTQLSVEVPVAAGARDVP